MSKFGAAAPKLPLRRQRAATTKIDGRGVIQAPSRETGDKKESSVGEEQGLTSDP